MKRFFTENFKLIFFLLIGLFILWYVTKGQNLERIVEEFINANYFWIILSMGISLLSHFVRALRWKILINGINYNPPVSKVFYALMTGYLTNMVLPRVGEVSRCVALGKSSKMPINMLFGTVIAERLLDTVCMFSILFIVVILQFSLLNEYLLDYMYLPLKAMLANNYLLIVLFLAACVALFFVIYYFFRHKIIRGKLGKLFTKGKSHLHGIKTGILAVKQMKNKVLFAFYTLLMWGLYLVMIFVTFYALESTSHLGISAALTILALGSLGVAVPVPAGIGTYHFIVITSLVELFYIGAEPATSFAYITHASQMLVVIFFGGFAWFKLAMKKSQVTYSRVMEENIKAN